MFITHAFLWFFFFFFFPQCKACYVACVWLSQIHVQSILFSLWCYFCVWVDLFSDTHTHLHTHARTHTHTHTHLHARTHTHLHTHARTHTHSHTHARAHTHTHTQTDTHKMVNNKTVHAVYLYKRQRIMYIVLYDLHFLYRSCFC